MNRIGKKKNLQPGMLDLPEQILRQIFSYLDHITLFLSLKEVCPMMKTYVDRYIGTGGIFLLVGEYGSPLELNFIFRRPSGIFDIHRKIISPIVCNSGQEHEGSPCEMGCPPFHRDSFCQLNYSSWKGTIIACPKYCCKNPRLYQYQYLKDTWKVIFKEVSFCEIRIRAPFPGEVCKHSRPINILEGTFLYPNQYSRNPALKIPPYLEINYHNEKDSIHEAKCHDGEGLIEFPIGKDSLLNFSICSKSNRIYLVGGLWKYPYGNETKKTKVDDKLKYLMGGTKFEINRTVLTIERVSSTMNIRYLRSRYIDEMPYRSKPLCFRLNNSLYMAGHVPCNDCNSKRHLTEEHILNSDLHFDKDDCKCCDRVDLSNETYHRNVHSIPYSLKRVTKSKIVSDKDESFAVISFYDPFDFEDKVWTFTEDAGFLEHSDLASEVRIIGSKFLNSLPGGNPPGNNTYYSFCNQKNECLSMKHQILRIQ